MMNYDVKMISGSPCEVSGHGGRVWGQKDKLESLVQVLRVIAAAVEHNRAAVELLRYLAAAVVRLSGV